MTPKQKTRASKFLSLVLRHKPEVIGIRLDANGWADCQTLIHAMQQRGLAITHSILHDIVAEDEKGRYSLDSHGRRIRANQGHSIAVELGLISLEPPEVLLHGTAQQALGLIYRDGLLPMGRLHVHMTDDLDAALRTGKRHGDPMVLMIQARVMFSRGHEFYRSENGVWLARHVPVEFLSTM